MERKNIVILGGSYGGISIAHNLLKHVVPKLPDSSLYRVIIVSAASQTMSRPACPRALISDDLFNQEKLFVNIPKLFEQYPKDNFRFIHGKATSLDHNSRNVYIDLAYPEKETIAFHALVIATGASTPSPLLGLNKDENFLRENWAKFREALPNAKSIVIVGGGPAGVETAAELGEYLNGRAGWFSSKLENPKVNIKLVTSGPSILPAFLKPTPGQQEPKPSIKAIPSTAASQLAKVGVTIIENTFVKTVVPESAGIVDVASKATLNFEGGTLEADLYIPATGFTPNTSFVDESLRTTDGRVDTNPSTLRVDKAGPRIYAIGDVSSVARPAVHLIFDAIPVLCANMKRDLLMAASPDSGAGEKNSFGEDRIYVEKTKSNQLIPLGTSVGVGSLMGYRVWSWVVWALKGRDYWLWTTGRLWSGKQWAKEG